MHKEKISKKISKNIFRRKNFKQKFEQFFSKRDVICDQPLMPKSGDDHDRDFTVQCVEAAVTVLWKKIVRKSG